MNESQKDERKWILKICRLSEQQIEFLKPIIRDCIHDGQQEYRHGELMDNIKMSSCRIGFYGCRKYSALPKNLPIFAQSQTAYANREFSNAWTKTCTYSRTH